MLGLARGVGMKIGILTHYDVNNLGAQLQMYALYKTLEELGHNPVVLTYNKNYDFKMEEKLKTQVSIKSVPYYLKYYLIRKGFGLTVHNVRKYMSNKRFRLASFQHEYYATADVDMVVVGSDEVFSLATGVNIMMYGHAVNTENVISYAPSFGQTDVNKIEKHHCENLIASGLSQFKAISARDEHTAIMVEELTGIKPVIVCDPVVLYDFSNAYTEPNLPNQKYLVVYSYDRHMIEKHEITAIKSYAKKRGLITVSPGTYHKWCDKNIVCNCLEWIGVFREAEAVITDTFHGTIVSAISNVPMAVYVRDKINANKLTDLLSRLGISDRRITEFSVEHIESILDKNIDFGLVNQRIVTMREEGYNYLVRAIGKCRNKGVNNE